MWTVNDWLILYASAHVKKCIVHACTHKHTARTYTFKNIYRGMAGGEMRLIVLRGFIIVWNTPMSGIVCFQLVKETKHVYLCRLRITHMLGELIILMMEEDHADVAFIPGIIFLKLHRRLSSLIKGKQKGDMRRRWKQLFWMKLHGLDLFISFGF
jgi:hypothetical protein